MYGIRKVVGGVQTPQGDEYIPFLLARTYQEQDTVRRILHDHKVRAGFTCELGCGYGRMTSVFKEYSDFIIAFERDRELLSIARKYFWKEDICFEKTDSLQSLNLQDECADVLFSFTVLQHVAPSEIGAVCQEITRVVSKDGLVFICEDNSPQEGPCTWGRSPQFYADVIGGKVIYREPRVTDTGEYALIRL
jgi:ubiquinone/menaquinone biosynthesis C-methylase UbiE